MMFFKTGSQFAILPAFFLLVHSSCSPISPSVDKHPIRIGPGRPFLPKDDRPASLTDPQNRPQSHSSDDQTDSNSETCVNSSQGNSIGPNREDTSGCKVLKKSPMPRLILYQIRVLDPVHYERTLKKLKSREGTFLVIGTRKIEEQIKKQNEFELSLDIEDASALSSLTIYLEIADKPEDAELNGDSTDSIPEVTLSLKSGSQNVFLLKGLSQSKLEQLTEILIRWQ